MWWRWWKSICSSVLLSGLFIIIFAWCTSLVLDVSVVFISIPNRSGDDVVFMIKSRDSGDIITIQFSRVSGRLKNCCMQRIEFKSCHRLDAVMIFAVCNIWINMIIVAIVNSWSGIPFASLNKLNWKLSISAWHDRNHDLKSYRFQSSYVLCILNHADRDRDREELLM